MSDLNLIELENITDFIANPNGINDSNDRLDMIRGSCKYYHYNCDDFKDVGWGCGYRTLQTLCSWIRNQMLAEDSVKSVADIPDILSIQKILNECGDKPSSFVGSKEWIGCFEASIVIDYLYDVPCKILHCNSGNLLDNLNDLVNHFQNIKSPIMMGGDLDNASKGIIGISTNSSTNTKPTQSVASLLVIDPHFYSKSKSDKKYLIENEWIKWKDINLFDCSDSFYNFCMPQKKFK